MINEEQLYTDFIDELEELPKITIEDIPAGLFDIWSSYYD